MRKKISNKTDSTNDKTIRLALRIFLDKELESYRKKGHRAETFEELGVRHGTTRIDFAIINGIMHGYEIKSDRDTLKRLPEQAQEFSAVFDKMTLVVGKRHLYQAIHIVPEWWGIIIAKTQPDGQIILQTIRKPECNKNQQNKEAIVRLLWREEALQILEKRNEASGLRSKPREFMYKKLADILDINTLRKQISSSLISREGWRLDGQPQLCGD